MPFEFDGIRSGQTTRGHRFLADEAFDVRRFDDYATGLEKHKVVLEADRRKEIILNDAKDRALALTALSQGRPPGPEAIDRFMGELVRAGMRPTLRRSRGADIDAACGQLAVRPERSPGSTPAS